MFENLLHSRVLVYCACGKEHDVPIVQLRNEFVCEACDMDLGLDCEAILTEFTLVEPTPAKQRLRA